MQIVSILDLSCLIQLWKRICRPTGLQYSAATVRVKLNVYVEYALTSMLKCHVSWQDVDLFLREKVICLWCIYADNQHCDWGASVIVGRTGIGWDQSGVFYILISTQNCMYISQHTPRIMSLESCCLDCPDFDHWQYNWCMYTSNGPRER